MDSPEHTTNKLNRSRTATGYGIMTIPFLNYHKYIFGSDATENTDVFNVFRVLQFYTLCCVFVDGLCEMQVR